MLASSHPLGGGAYVVILACWDELGSERLVPWSSGGGGDWVFQFRATLVCDGFVNTFETAIRVAAECDFPGSFEPPLTTSLNGVSYCGCTGFQSQIVLEIPD